MKKTCKTCSFWAHPKDGSAKGQCPLAMSISGVSVFKGGTKAVAQDYESYEAFLETQADFGCNQWQKIQKS